MSEPADVLRAGLEGRYRIDRLIGSGGMATVYSAEDLRHGRRVAIKVFRPEVAAAVGADRFMREIRVTARLAHPHILPLYDSGETAGAFWYATALIEGGSLRDRLEREKQLPVEDAVRITREIADALGHAHQLGIVHRDIKPENILLSGDHAIVADFGIARLIGPVADSLRTTLGTVLGTPAYMSPEQAAGGDHVDSRSDIYSLACVTYEMLAGQTPFTGPTGQSIIAQHLSLPPRPVTGLRPGTPPAVESALDRALSKAAADRFTTAGEFSRAIQITETARVVPTPPNPGWLRSWRVPLLVVALIGTAAAIFLGPWNPLASLAGRKPPAKKDWLLVAQFDASPTDSQLAVASRDLVVSALDQSEIVAVVPRDQVQLALEQAGKPRGTRVDGPLARELAYRRSIRAVLEGQVSAVGSSISIIVRAIDAEDGRTIFSVNEHAQDERVLVKTIERLGRRVREKLGENRRALSATRPLAEAMTPSFPAYQMLLRARELNNQGNVEGALLEIKEALKLDPEFASGWSARGTYWMNLLQQDSALVSFRHLLTLPDQRVSAAVRLEAETAIAQVEGNVDEAVTAGERLVALDPANARNHSLLAMSLSTAGREKESLDQYNLAIERSPFGPSPILRWNQVAAYGALGYWSQVDSLLPYLTNDDRRRRAAYHLALARRDWARADSLSRLLTSWFRPSNAGNEEAFTAFALAARGNVTAGRQALMREVTRLRESGSPVAHHAHTRGLLFFDSVTGVPGSRPVYPDTTAHELVTHATWEATHGDTALARTLLHRFQSSQKGEIALEGNSAAYVEALILARGEHWEEVLRVVDPLHRKAEPGMAYLGTGRVAPMWLAARACEKLGQLDSTSVLLKRALKTLEYQNIDQFYSAMIHRYLLHRLVLVDCRLGRIEQARAHWQELIAAPFEPDAGMQERVDEARRALEAAEAMRSRQ